MRRRRGHEGGGEWIEEEQKVRGGGRGEGEEEGHEGGGEWIEEGQKVRGGEGR
jgi:hypothetical protein